MQDRSLDRLRQLTEKTFEPLDDVQKRRPVHSISDLRLVSTITPIIPVLMSLNLEILSRAANEARGLCMDAVQASKSGHLGLPLGCAEMGAVLYGYALKHNPEQPRWIGRDYFVLSAGHGSMFLYAWLHLSGYDVSLDDIRNFRQLHSKTPGHPEYFETPGVECTTGPLGQGVGNAVGVAMATTCRNSSTPARLQRSARTGSRSSSSPTPSRAKAFLKSRERPRRTEKPAPNTSMRRGKISGYRQSITLSRSRRGTISPSTKR